MKLTTEEQYMCLSDDEVIELRRKENRCVYCGALLKFGFEDYECWGRKERVKIQYCPKCG